MRAPLALLALLMTACSASADLPGEAEAEVVEFDSAAARADDLDARVRALRLRLDGADVDADVLAQALDVHARALDTLEDIVRDLDDRADGAESIATTAWGIAQANEDLVADQGERLADVEALAADAATRVDRLEAGPAGLRSVDIDAAVCGLAQEDGGIIYRIAPDVRPGELLLRADEDASLRVEVPVQVTCGVTSVGSGADLPEAPSAVVDGGAVYLAVGGGDWFRVAR